MWEAAWKAANNAYSADCKYMGCFGLVLYPSIMILK